MWTFNAMSTEVLVAAPFATERDEAAAAARIATLFADTEARFSRFRPDSELARLNRSTGPFAASVELLDVLAAARRHVDATDGLFDPAIGRALVHAGYDRSFAPGALDRDDDRHDDAPPPRAHFDELVVDAQGFVTRPPHLLLDLGGFLKGRTADRAATLLPPCSLIDAGGDAVLRGAGLDGAGWEVDVEDPDDAGHVLVTLRVRDGAVATSAANRRTWRAGDTRHHHLLDPRTGRPAETDVRQATVLAPTAEEADVLAKLVFLLGLDEGATTLRARRRSGVIVDAHGALHLVGDVHVERAHA